MSDIVWEDPPDTSTRGRPGRWAQFIAELKKHPGKWAIAKAGMSDGATNLYTTFKQAGCEGACRKQPDGTHTFYARWPEDAS